MPELPNNRGKESLDGTGLEPPIFHGRKLRLREGKVARHQAASGEPLVGLDTRQGTQVARVWGR